MFILTESVQTGNNFHFKAKIFDIGFEPLPSHEAFDSDGFERREEEAIEAKKQEAKNEIAAKPSSIDDLLVPSGMLGLAALAIDSYYGNKKAIPITNRMLDYIFIPSASRFNVLNDNYRISIFHKPIELIPYAKGYSIAWFDAGYSAARDYKPLQEKGILPYSEIKPVNYMHIPRLYSALFADREALPYIAAKNYYDAFEPKIAEIKPVDGIKIADTYLPHAAYTSIGENYETRIKPINYSRAFAKSIEETAIQAPTANIPIQIKTHHAKTHLTDNFPRLLEEVVEESPEISHKAAYSGHRINVPYIFFNLPKPQNDNERKNHDTDISDAVLQAFEPDEQENQIVYRHVEQKPANDNTKMEEPSHSINHKQDTDDISDYKDPERRRNTDMDYKLPAKKEKTKYRAIIKNLKKKMDEARRTAKEYSSLVSKTQSDKTEYKTQNAKSETKQEEAYDVPTPQRQPELNKISFEKEIAEALEHSAYEHKLETGAKNLGFAVYDMETKRHFGHYANMLLPTPSINKVALAATIAYYVQHGKLDWGQELTIQKDLIIKNDGSYNIKEGRKVKLGEMVDLMLRRSVDTYFNHILFALGDGDVYAGIEKNNKFMDDLGFQSIKIGDIHTENSNYNSSVSHADNLIGLMYFLMKGNVLEQRNSSMIIGAMEKEEWSPFFKGPRKITSKLDGMGILGVIEGRYIVFSEVDDFNGRKLAEHAYNEHGNRITNRATPLGVSVINSIARNINSLYAILSKDMNHASQKAA